MNYKFSKIAIKSISVLIISAVSAVIIYGATFIAFGSIIHLKLHKADAIVVLGSARALSAEKRALQGLKLYEQGLAPEIILSGGQTTLPIAEAIYMKNIITKANPDAKLLIDDKALNTIQNLTNVKGLDPKAKNIIIVSDEYHILRSYITAKSLGFQKIEWSTPNENYMPLKQRANLYFTEMTKLYKLLFG